MRTFQLNFATRRPLRTAFINPRVRERVQKYSAHPGWLVPRSFVVVREENGGVLLVFAPAKSAGAHLFCNFPLDFSS